MTAKPFDPTLKTLVEIGPRDWLLLAGDPAAPVRIIDSDLSTVSGAADKVLRVDTAKPYLLHLEFVSGHDSSELPRMLNARASLLEQRHDLPVRSVVVLLRPEANSPALTGQYQRAILDEPPYRHFDYRVIRLWGMAANRLLKGGLGTLPLAVASAVTEGELPGIIERMRQRLDRRSARKLAPSLWAATYILLGLRYSADVAYMLLQGVLSMRESTTYQAILEEGRQEGAVTEVRKLLVLMGEPKLGKPSAATRKALESIADLNRLEAMSVRLLQAESWQDLLQESTPPPSPRRRRHNSEET